MSLIKSISGIRGTIGGKPGEGFSPLDVVKFTSAYGTWLQGKVKKEKVKLKEQKILDWKPFLSMGSLSKI